MSTEKPIPPETIAEQYLGTDRRTLNKLHENAAGWVYNASGVVDNARDVSYQATTHLRMLVGALSHAVVDGATAHYSEAQEAELRQRLHNLRFSLLVTQGSLELVREVVQATEHALDNFEQERDGSFVTVYQDDSSE